MFGSETYQVEAHAGMTSAFTAARAFRASIRSHFDIVIQDRDQAAPDVLTLLFHSTHSRYKRGNLVTVAVSCRKRAGRRNVAATKGEELMKGANSPYFKQGRHANKSKQRVNLA